MRQVGTKMRSVSLISITSLIMMLSLTVPAWSNERYPCVHNMDGKIVCPPPGGKCLVNANQEFAAGQIVAYALILLLHESKELIMLHTQL
jgi:hypothetical protein